MDGLPFKLVARYNIKVTRQKENFKLYTPTFALCYSNPLHPKDYHNSPVVSSREYAPQDKAYRLRWVSPPGESLLS